jgi:hypothetical protein
MDLTREEALKLHRQMWTDMQNVLGNDPGIKSREAYKEDWCDKHGFENVKNDCFLCEYSHDKSPAFCYHCPVKWPTWSGTCFSGYLEDGTKLGGELLPDCPYQRNPGITGKRGCVDVQG